MSRRWTLVGALALTMGCQGGVEARVDASRAEHFFDRPYPSDELLVDGMPDLTGFPQANVQLAQNILGGWAERIELSAHGYGNNTAAVFRFEGALDLPTATEGLADDPVVWVAMDGSHQLPLELRFIDDPQGDPYYASNTLTFAPALGHATTSGTTYAAVVMRSAGVRAPSDYELPDGVHDALDAAGIEGKPAVATVFTIQDATGELRQLADDVDRRLGGSWDWATSPTAGSLASTSPSARPRGARTPPSTRRCSKTAAAARPTWLPISPPSTASI